MGNKSLETFIALGKILPEEIILDYIKERMKTYEANKTNENKQHLAMAMDLFSLKASTEGTSADDLVKRVNTYQKMDEILKGSK